MRADEFDRLVNSARKGHPTCLKTLLAFTKPASPTKVEVAGEFLFATLTRLEQEEAFTAQALRLGVHRLASQHATRAAELEGDISDVVDALQALAVRLSDKVVVPVPRSH